MQDPEDLWPNMALLSLYFQAWCLSYVKPELSSISAGMWLRIIL